MSLPGKNFVDMVNNIINNQPGGNKKTAYFILTKIGGKENTYKISGGTCDMTGRCTTGFQQLPWIIDSNDPIPITGTSPSQRYWARDGMIELEEEMQGFLSFFKEQGYDIMKNPGNYKVIVTPDLGEDKDTHRQYIMLKLSVETIKQGKAKRSPSKPINPCPVC